MYLQVDAPLVVPDQCDALHLQVFRGSRSGPQLLDRTYDLSRGPSFPLTLTLTTADAQNIGGEGLFVSASAERTGALAQPWAEAHGQVTLSHGALSQIHLRICNCP